MRSLSRGTFWTRERIPAAAASPRRRSKSLSFVAVFSADALLVVAGDQRGLLARGDGRIVGDGAGDGGVQLIRAEGPVQVLAESRTAGVCSHIVVGRHDDGRHRDLVG